MLLYDAMKVRFNLQMRRWDVGDSRTLGCAPRKAAGMEWTGPREKRCVLCMCVHVFACVNMEAGERGQISLSIAVCPITLGQGFPPKQRLTISVGGQQAPGPACPCTSNARVRDMHRYVWLFM